VESNSRAPVFEVNAEERMVAFGGCLYTFSMTFDDTRV